MKGRTFWVILGALALLSPGIYAKEKMGKLKMDVSPRQAYTFIDGEAQGPGNRSIRVAPGDHMVLVANYGYKFFQKQVYVEPGATVGVDVKLEPFGGAVFSARGRIQIEAGHHISDKSAVLLNGKTPDYFVGHVDEFNHDIWWHQQLIVPPGTHIVTVTRFGKEIWSGPVTVDVNRRVILNIAKDTVKVKPWDGEKLGELPRFKAGIANSKVVVAPVTAAISATPPSINCGQSSMLAWNSTEAIDATMTGMSPVPLTGERSMSPLQTTTYAFTATGPGGVAGANTTIAVNPTVTSSLGISTPEVRYRRIGDKVLQQQGITLNWASSNADAISLAPFGPVDPSGSKSMMITPTQTANGPIDETFNYTLSASNMCGGSETRSISVHMVGSIEPIPDVLLHSVYFPTDYPAKVDPKTGLLRSQQEALTALAKGFNAYLEYDPDAKLSLAAFADERGPQGYNQSLSERRGDRVKDFLVSQGIAADKISVSAYGLDQQLDKTTVFNLQQQNPQQPIAEQVRQFHTTWLAYNRRVDVVLQPTNRESLRFYPNAAPDAGVLWQRAIPPMKTVEEDQ